MAWQMSYTDTPNNETYASSYWTIAQYNTQPKYSETGMIIFYGYVDAAHKGKRVIGQKSYTISPTDYANLIKTAVPSPIPKDVTTTSDLILHTIYVWAQGVQDGVDANGNAISFFANATKA